MPRRSSQPTKPSGKNVAGSSMTQLTPSQQKAFKALSKEVQKERISHIVQYVMKCVKCKRGVVRRTDLLKLFDQDQDNSASASLSVLVEQARKQLNNIFGYQLVEYRSGVWAVINALKQGDHIADYPQDAASSGLLLAVLTATFMSQGQHIAESALRRFLNEVGVSLEPGHRHPLFHEATKLLDQFVHDGYLVKQHVTVGDIQEWDYSLGERALETIRLKNLLNFGLEVMGLREVDFPEQLRLARAQARNRNQDNEEED